MTFHTTILWVQSVLIVRSPRENTQDHCIYTCRCVASCDFRVKSDAQTNTSILPTIWQNDDGLLMIDGMRWLSSIFTTDAQTGWILFLRSTPYGCCSIYKHLSNLTPHSHFVGLSRIHTNNARFYPFLHPRLCFFTSKNETTHARKRWTKCLRW